MREKKVEPLFWKGKRVFITGHTGFKGGWLSLWLANMGANVTGFSLAPNTTPSIFEVTHVKSQISQSIIGDIRDLSQIRKAITSVNPEIVIHMAAQPLVRYSYENPIETYETNVMGTLHLLEAIRSVGTVKAVVVVTTDKCYENDERLEGFKETDPMGGYDPYSSSKGCTELVVSAYQRSYFNHVNPGAHNMGLATARAGNVIGGGDWSVDRLIPDAIKAFESNETLLIRNPNATRPWQHVLEPLAGYLMLAQNLYVNSKEFSSAWNFGPLDKDERTVKEVLELFIKKWPEKAEWKKIGTNQPHEANFLKLDCKKANEKLGWFPKWDLSIAIENIITWHQALRQGLNMKEITLSQIKKYQSS